MIKRFAEHLKRSSRCSDVAICLGGDEFLVVLPECTPDGCTLSAAA